MPFDLFWPGVMLGEHRSAGVDLDAACPPYIHSEGAQPL